MFRQICKKYPFEHGKYSLLQRVYFRHLAPRTHAVATYDIALGLKMHLDIDEFLQAHIYLFGSYELPTVRFLRKVLTPASTAFDVGAQMGYLSLAMATTGAGVVAFEPEAANIARLHANIALNDARHITVIEKAVSDHDGEIRLYLSKDNNAGTHSTIAAVGNVSEEYVTIPCVRLDTYLASAGAHHSVDLIKIDVEGGEREVISGALETLQRDSPILIMEMSDALQEARGYSTREFKAMLADLGYSSFTLNDNGSLQPSDVSHSHVMENVVFVHHRRRESLRQIVR